MTLLRTTRSDDIVANACFALENARPLHNEKRPRFDVDFCPVHRTIGAHGAHDAFVLGVHLGRPFACIGSFRVTRECVSRCKRMSFWRVQVIHA